MNQHTRTLARSTAGISIENVSLSYGTTSVLKAIDLEIRPGEFFAFLGPSGCGKTTLLRLIAGFNTAQQGSVRIGGQEISGLPPWKRDVGMVFQSYALWPHMNVRRNVAFGLEERRLKRAEIDRRVDAALDLVGLKHLADRKPSQLSGGQQQRVALARTVVIEPKVLLLDEPLSNLDAQLRVQMRRELLDFQRKLGLTTIFVTHDQEEANTICDRIAVLNAGAIQQVGAPMELYDSPANLFVAGFLGTANILSGEVLVSGKEQVFALPGGGRVPLRGDAAAGTGGQLMFRPQNAEIVPFEAPPRPDRTRLEGVLAHREFLGGTVRYGVRLGTSEIVVDQPHQAGDALLAEHSPVGLDLDSDKVRVLAS